VVNGYVIKAIIPALAALIALTVFKLMEPLLLYFQNVIKDQSVLNKLNIAINLGAIATAIAITYMLEFVAEYAYTHVKVLRYMLDPRSRFEGYWAVDASLHGRVPHGFISIEYDQRQL